jgi:hypothetical protein
VPWFGLAFAFALAAEMFSFEELRLTDFGLLFGFLPLVSARSGWTFGFSLATEPSFEIVIEFRLGVSFATVLFFFIKFLPLGASILPLAGALRSLLVSVDLPLNLLSKDLGGSSSASLRYSSSKVVLRFQNQKITGRLDYKVKSLVSDFPFCG